MLTFLAPVSAGRSFVFTTAGIAGTAPAVLMAAMHEQVQERTSQQQDQGKQVNGMGAMLAGEKEHRHRPESEQTPPKAGL
jgi:hypothetical protein